MKYLKIPEHVYTAMLAVLEQRPLKEVYELYNGLQGLHKANDGDLLVATETIQPVVNFMHTRCLHCEVHEILKAILAAPNIEVADDPTPRSRKASVNSKT
jgi:hypothetical protein